MYPKKKDIDNTFSFGIGVNVAIALPDICILKRKRDNIFAFLGDINGSFGQGCSYIVLMDVNRVAKLML